MPHVARSIDPRTLLQPRGRIWLRLARRGLAGALMASALPGCPSPTAQPTRVAAREEPTPTPTAEPSAPAPAPATRAELAPRPVDPSPTPTPGSDVPLPPALAADGVRPVLQSLWRAVEAVDGGDTDAMARTMLPDARWFPPGSAAESVPQADLRRAMNPWTSPELELDVRRMIDLGGPFVAQLAVGSNQAQSGQPPSRYELVLVVETRDDRIASVRHYGDPLGPVRMGPDPSEPLDLGPVGEVVLERARPNPEAEALAKALTEALDGRKDPAAQALLAEDVVLHDVTARRTRRGREGYLAGYRATMGDTGHLVVDRQHSSADLVVFEGAVHGREADAEEPREYGFADVHRVVDGAIVETWHYVNRRSSPSRTAISPERQRIEP